MPEYPVGQLHTNPDPLTVHDPLLVHRADVHGVTSQLSHENPAGQSQLHVAPDNTLTPPF